MTDKTIENRRKVGGDYFRLIIKPDMDRVLIYIYIYTLFKQTTTPY